MNMIPLPCHCGMTLKRHDWDTNTTECIGCHQLWFQFEEITDK